jgi:hypothetical protein
MKYSLVFADEYPPALAQDFQEQFLDILLADGGVGAGYADSILPCRTLRRRATNVPNP